MDGLVSGFEKKLSEDGPIPDVPNVIQARTDDIQVKIRSPLVKKENAVTHRFDLTELTDVKIAFLLYLEPA